MISKNLILLSFSPLVKISVFSYNPQVTKVFNSRVGTSETLRMLSSNSKDKKFFQWLAGLIDGKGCFLLSKQGYGSLEITMSLLDHHCLNMIKQKYGGS